MKTDGAWATTKAGWCAVAFVLSGCGQDAPPYDDLPLRDALRASPDVIAGLSYDTRRDLAMRLDNAALEQETESTLTVAENASIDALADVADEAREDLESDALVIGEVLPEAQNVRLRSEDIDAPALERSVVGPIFLQGARATSTKALEDVALRGRAGKWLRALSGRTGAIRMVRTTGLPMGAWTYKDTLYVNASWLVAMSALEENITPPAKEFTVPGDMPGKTPLTVDYNPYRLPSTVVECAAQVINSCQCLPDDCLGEVTDPTFANATEECAWVNADATHATALCVLALMAVDDVRACMETGAFGCFPMPPTNHDEAVMFIQNSACPLFIDQCLREGFISDGTTGTACDTCNDCSGCNGCSDTNGGNSCGNGCSQCNDNCSQCNQNCSDSQQNANSCGKCSVKPSPARSPLPTPLSTSFWLLAPLAYVWLRGRRRS